MDVLAIAPQREALNAIRAGFVESRLDKRYDVTCTLSPYWGCAALASQRYDILVVAVEPRKRQQKPWDDGLGVLQLASRTVPPAHLRRWLESPDARSLYTDFCSRYPAGKPAVIALAAPVPDSEPAPDS